MHQRYSTQQRGALGCEVESAAVVVEQQTNTVAQAAQSARTGESFNWTL